MRRLDERTMLGVALLTLVFTRREVLRLGVDAQHRRLGGRPMRDLRAPMHAEPASPLARGAGWCRDREPGCRLLFRPSSPCSRESCVARVRGTRARSIRRRKARPGSGERPRPHDVVERATVRCRRGSAAQWRATIASPQAQAWCLGSSGAASCAALFAACPRIARRVLARATLRSRRAGRARAIHVGRPVGERGVLARRSHGGLVPSGRGEAGRPSG